jgi:hypothetical protein
MSTSAQQQMRTRMFARALAGLYLTYVGWRPLRS